MSYIGQGLEQAYSERYVFTAAGGETSVSVADDGRTVAYVIGQVDVYKNGLRLVSGNDFSASSGTSITGLATLSAGDVVEIVAYAVVIAPDAVSASAGGTFQDAITVQGAVSATGVVSASGGSSTDWNAAFAWGNHASSGYLTGNQTITLTGDVTGSGTTSIAVIIADDSHNHVISNVDGLQAELDSKLPSATWTSAAASGITSAQVTNWDTAYGWGDHASAGYLTSFTETDPVFSASAASGITSTNITNWNTAYGWGDHASAGYLSSSSYTAADVLSKLVTVDGASSGLDADLLDGVHASSFVRSDAVTIMSSTGIGRNDHHRGHLVGSYNNVGANDTKTNPIYSIGSAYIPSATSLSGSYGLGFSHPNFWGSGKTAGWGIYTTDNGTITFTAGYSGGASDIGVWSQGVVDARGFTTNSNPWSTDDSAWMPNGITTPGVTSWLYGTVYLGNAPSNGSGSQADANGIETAGWHKANIYYDRDNTGYYTDPAAATSAKFAQFVQIGDSSSYGTNSGSWGARLNVTDNVHAKIEVGQDADGMLSHWYAHTGQSSVKFGTTSSHDLEIQRGNTQKLYIGASETTSYNPLVISANWGTGSYADALTVYGTYPSISLRSTNANGGTGQTFLMHTDSGGTIQYYFDTSGPYEGWTKRHEFFSDGRFDATSQIRTPIVYDRNNTSYFIDPDSASNLRKINSFAVGSGWDDQLNLYSADGVNRWNVLCDNGAGDPLRIAFNNSEKFNIATNGEAYFTNGLRSTIYYDRDNTGYYVDPASTGICAVFNGEVQIPGPAGTTHFNYPNDGGNNYFRGYNNYFDQNQTWIHDLRARVMYDWDDTGFYLDPTSSSLLRTVYTQNSSYHFRPRYTDNSDVYSGSFNWYGLQMGNNGANYIVAGRTAGGGFLDIYVNNTSDFPSINGTHSSRFDNNGIFYNYHSVRAPIFYDHNNTGYYVDPANQNVFAGPTVYGGNRSSGVYGSYSPYSLAHIWAMDTAYTLTTSGGAGNLYGLNYSYEPNYGGSGNNPGAISGLGHQMQWRSNGATQTAIGTGVYTVGNVTAYSDRRVKTNIKRIPNALDKVCKLNGYTYERTDLGLDEVTGEKQVVRQAGVIAQEVLEVLPEVVSGSEELHYSVAYGNMVALLIEAVKEQQTQIEAMAAEIKSLKEMK